MKNLNHKNLDWHLLQVFLSVLQESHVTRAAERLGLTQSTISHSLNKLRVILGDPLFIKSGKGIMPTERAKSLRDPVRRILDEMKSLADEKPFDPTDAPLNFIVAANDLTRDLLFPHLLRSRRNEGVDLRLQFVPSGVPDATLLSEAQCDLIITPLPPDGPDNIQSKLFEGEMACFYDADKRAPPASLDEYLNDQHIVVRFAEGKNSFQVMPQLDRSRIREPIVSVSNFGAITPFVKGSNLIATELDYMSLGPLKDLDRAPLPFPSNPIAVYMVWHRRDNSNPAHRWLQENIRSAVAELKL